jgi:hypothetical protein
MRSRKEAPAAGAGPVPPGRGSPGCETRLTLCKANGDHFVRTEGATGQTCRITVSAKVRVTYPFEPKSIAFLRAGQFWAVPLSDGRFGCGRVLYVPSPSDPQPSLYLNIRIFLGGLMDWSGYKPPTAQAIAGCELLEQGRVHVAAITDTGSKILGRRDLEQDGLSGLLQVSHPGGGTVWLYEGGKRLRAATGQERQTLPVMSVWGRRVIVLLAERHLLHREP